MMPCSWSGVRRASRIHTATTRGWITLKNRRFRGLSLFVVAAVLGVVPLAAPALAAPATVVTDLNPDTGFPAGRTASLSFSISPDSRTLSKFTLSPPSGYKVEAIGTVSAGAAVLTPAGAIAVTGLAISPSQTATVTFTAKASCVSGTHAWPVEARDTQNRVYNATGDRSTDVAGNCGLAFVNQPGNTKAGELITSGDRQTGGPIQVQLVDGLNNPVTHFPVDVTFGFGSNPNGASATLTVGTETTNANGIATFDDETPAAEGGDGLEINKANVAAFTDYTILPKGATTATASISGPASAGFDIWEDATKCLGANCALSHDGDEYLVPNGQENALLSASTFSTAESNINCAGYTEITGDVVWHEYTGSAAVLVKIHITRTEMKASANNGQALVKVCVGLLDEGALTGQQKWANLGVVADHQDSDGDGFDDIWVALAPNCPNQTPDQFAPCVARQYGDGAGGSFTEVWIPGGDPPRRT
jgi:hypothetical protein